MKKRILSVFVTFCMVLTLLPMNVFAAGGPFIEGGSDVSSSNYTEISTAEELYNIRNNLTGAYKLTADIDLSDFGSWTPIGTKSAPFRGLLDGNGYKITNLTITSTVSGLDAYGLFGYTQDALIVDLGLEDTKIDLDTSSMAGLKVGALAGYMTDTTNNSNPAYVENCYNTGSIQVYTGGSVFQGSDCVGGLVGYVYSYSNTQSMVLYSYNTADITVQSNTVPAHASGLVGDVGGAGGSYNSNFQIGYSFNSGDVAAYVGSGSSASAAVAGGLLAYSTGAYTMIGHCYNSGTVDTYGVNYSTQSKNHQLAVGGLVGINNDTMEIFDSYNVGNVSADEDSPSGNVTAGGIIGGGAARTLLNKCYNSGNVEAANNHFPSYGKANAGGLAGDISGSSVGAVQNSFILAQSIRAYGDSVYTGYAVGGSNSLNIKKSNLFFKGGIVVGGSSGATQFNDAKGFDSALATEETTYSDIGWAFSGSGAAWKMVPDYKYPQLIWQTEELGYTGSGVTKLAGSVTIDNTTPRIGSVLTANTSSLTSKPAGEALGTLSYQWLRDNTAIEGATGASYTAVEADIGSQLRVKVTAANCAGSVTSDPTAAVADGPKLTVSIEPATYNGQAQTPVLTITGSEGQVEQNTDYTVELVSQTNAGTYPVTVVGKGDYEGVSVTVNFVIAPKSIKDAAVSLEKNSYVWTGSAIEPQVTSVTVDGLTLTTGDYTVSYKNNTAIGTATVTVTAKGNYTGTASKTFTITEVPEMKAAVAPVTYNGQPQTPVLTVTDSEGVALTQGIDYTAQLTAQIDAGTYAIAVTGMGDFQGSKTTADFVIAPKSIDSAAVTLDQDVFMYTGSAIEPAVTSVVVDGLKLENGDYTVSYSNNIEVGEATVAVTAKEGGNYTGSAAKNFTITLSGYSFQVASKDQMVVGEMDSTASATLTAEDNAITFEHALIKVEVTGPEGSKAQVLATDTTGVEWNLAEAGQWGPEGGFRVDSTYNVTTPLKLSFDMAGTYTAKFTLVDLDDNEKVLASGSKTITVTDAYSFAVETPETMVRGQVADASATLLGDTNAPAYDHALVKVTVTGPEGSKPQILATDTNGKEWNLAEVGQWGPDGGFRVEANYNIETPLKLSFDKAGEYTATFQLVDVTTGKVLGSGSSTITVTDAYSFVIDAPETVVRGQKTDASATLTGDANAPAYANALIKVTVTGPEGSKPQILATDTNGKEWNLAEVGQWGPDGGFPVGAGYAVTTPLKLSFDMAGTYTAEFTLVDVTTGEVLGSGSKTITVKNPSSGGGGGSASSYTLTFNTNGGSKIASVSESRGTVIDLDKYVPTKPGFAFDGWYSDAKLANKITSVKLTKNTTVYAKWVEGSDKNDFDDVAEDAYYSDAVDWAVSEGITAGTSGATFSPNMSCTRAQTVTFLWRAAGSPEPKSGANPFTDVKKDDYFCDAVLWAVENGVTAGTSETTFSPDATVTRAQTVTFLWRMAGSPAPEAAGAFDDVASDAYYANAVLWTVEHGITAGTSETTFSPDADCTRAQIVTFLWRYMAK